MKIRFLPRFEKGFKKLPENIKILAEKRTEIFRINPFNPQLKTHKLHGELEDFWSFSLNQKYRIIFGFRNEDAIIFYSAGTHDIY